MKIIDIIPGVKVYQEEGFSILFGCPPEVIKHFMLRQIPFPDYVVLPDILYFKGVMQNATEFVFYYHLFVQQNFFKGKKLKILGEEQHVRNNNELLRLTLLGPTWEEYTQLDPNNQNPYYKNLYRESRALALKDKEGKEVPIDGFLDSQWFKDGVIETELFTLTHSNTNIYEINGQVIDINFSEEQTPPYDLNPNFIPIAPSKFGIDVLGGASGFIPNKPCSSLILNYYSEYMLIDCIPYLEYTLKARGISRNQIKSLFLTHIHDDHCNIFPLVQYHEKVKILTTKEIFWMACKKLSLMTLHDIEEFYSYFDFVELEPYRPNNFYGMKVTPHYTVHSIPTIGATFEMQCRGESRSIVFGGDNKALPDIKKMVEEGTVEEEKYQKLHKLFHDEYDLFFADGGLGMLHGDPKDSIESKSKSVIFLHMEKLPNEFNTTFNTAIHGKRFVLEEATEYSYVIKAMNILSGHYAGISEKWQNALINNMRIRRYNTDDVIMKQGQKNDGKTFIILSGTVKILKHTGNGFQQFAANQAGDLVGEMALLNRVETRSASLIAGTPVTLGELDGEVLYSFLESENRILPMLEMLKTRSILEGLFYNHGLSMNAHQRIAWAGKHLRMKKGEVVVKQGDTDNEFYFVLEGSLAVIKDGQQINVLTPRDIFGEFASLGYQRRNATIEALEDSEVLQVRRGEMLSIIKKTPSFNFYVNKIIRERGGDFII